MRQPPRTTIDDLEPRRHERRGSRAKVAIAESASEDGNVRAAADDEAAKQVNGGDVGGGGLMGGGLVGNGGGDDGVAGAMGLGKDPAWLEPRKT